MPLDMLRKRRFALDPLHDQPSAEDHGAYEAMKRLSYKKLNALIDVLILECVMAHLRRRTELVWRLAAGWDVGT
jgi:hypothetical protein